MWGRNPKYPVDESTRFDPTRPSEYLAPSWSWASILGNLSAMSNIWKTRDALAISALKVAQILDLHTVTKNYDPFGQPSDFLKLSPFQQIVYNSARVVDAPGSGLPGMDFLLLESTGEKGDEFRRIGEASVRKNQLPYEVDVTADSYSFMALENLAYDEVDRVKVNKRTITIV
ncbi:hypothetical protein DL95DRAFT_433818 [Leptodontidium sp. 2 PMI_412]|nr:hypothetical protein DL95DRAFT_433818 [Leptodontidium sp. 2 PMI_412]